MPSVGEMALLTQSCSICTSNPEAPNQQLRQRLNVLSDDLMGKGQELSEVQKYDSRVHGVQDYSKQLHRERKLSVLNQWRQ